MIVKLFLLKYCAFRYIMFELEPWSDDFGVFKSWSRYLPFNECLDYFNIHVYLITQTIWSCKPSGEIWKGVYTVALPRNEALTGVTIYLQVSTHSHCCLEKCVWSVQIAPLLKRSNALHSYSIIYQNIISKRSFFVYWIIYGWRKWTEIILSTRKKIASQAVAFRVMYAWTSTQILFQIALTTCQRIGNRRLSTNWYRSICNTHTYIGKSWSH